MLIIVEGDLTVVSCRAEKKNLPQFSRETSVIVIYLQFWIMSIMWSASVKTWYQPVGFQVVLCDKHFRLSPYRHTCFGNIFFFVCSCLTVFYQLLRPIVSVLRLHFHYYRYLFYFVAGVTTVTITAVIAGIPPLSTSYLSFLFTTIILIYNIFSTTDSICNALTIEWIKSKA